jgi:ParB-like chromosome segregation protein Spo0J
MAKRKIQADLTHITPDLRDRAALMAELQLDPANAKKHPQTSIDSIAASLKRYGQRKPIVVHATTGVIEAGNGTFLAARQLGWLHIAVVRVDDDTAAAVGFAVADNRTAEFSQWDDVQLALATSTIAETDSELADLLMLSDLVAANSPPDEPAESTGSRAKASKYSILIECRDAKHQKALNKRLKAEGFPAAKLLKE